MPISPQGSIHCCRSKKSGDPVFIGPPLFVFIGCALTMFDRMCYNHKQSALERVHILYSAVESCSRKGVIAMTWMEFLTLCNVVCDIILILQNSNKRK